MQSCFKGIFTHKIFEDLRATYILEQVLLSLQIEMQRKKTGESNSKEYCPAFHTGVEKLTDKVAFVFNCQHSPQNSQSAMWNWTVPLLEVHLVVFYWQSELQHIFYMKAAKRPNRDDNGMLFVTCMKYLSDSKYTFPSAGLSNERGEGKFLLTALSLRRRCQRNYTWATVQCALADERKWRPKVYQAWQDERSSSHFLSLLLTAAFVPTCPTLLLFSSPLSHSGQV